MVEEALQTGSIMTLVVTAASLGFIHTIFGPDHYVPFVMMSRAMSMLCLLEHCAQAALFWEVSPLVRTVTTGHEA